MINLAQFLCGAFALAYASYVGDSKNVDAPKWSDRGVFVFGPILIDFNKEGGTEVVKDRSISKLENCSTPDFYCARGGIVNVVVPRACDTPLIDGNSWKIGGITTTVLYSGVESPPLKKVITKTYLLGSDKYPNIIWTYRLSTGINGVYFDSSNMKDLVSLAKSGGTAVLNKGVVNDEYEFFGLSTLDAFGHCDAQ